MRKKELVEGGTNRGWENASNVEVILSTLSIPQNDSDSEATLDPISLSPEHERNRRNFLTKRHKRSRRRK